jgi:glucosamine kinase
MPFYLGLDVGGTKTEYVLADETRELARVLTGSIKRSRVDAETATRNLDEALANLSSRTGVSMQSIAQTCIGTAGSVLKVVTEWMREAFAQRVSGPLLLVDDVEIALDAAFFGGPGVLIMAGTGSNVAGRTSAGAITKVGGYGPPLADQGSGHRIGYQGLRDLFLSIDEEKPTLLLQAILQHWKLASIEELIGYANRIPSPDFSQLAPVVTACAAQGDAIAQNVLHREAEELAHLGYLAIERLRRADTRKDWVPDIAFTGSILKNVPPVRDGIVSALERRFPQLKALPGVVDPVVGALWRARTETQLHTEIHPKHEECLP